MSMKRLAAADMKVMNIIMSMKRLAVVDMKVMNIIMSMERLVVVDIIITMPTKYLKAGVRSRSQNSADKSLRIFSKNFRKAVSTV